MNNPNLSIVTVSYNNIGGLKRTYESIIKQQSRPREWVVIDGGSSDGTREWLQKLEAPFPVAWRSEADFGIYDGMNKGIGVASGDFYLFLNAGDYLCGQVLSLSYDRPCIIRCRTVDLLGRQVEVKPRSSRYGMPVPHQAIVFPAVPHLEYDLNYAIGADWDFFLRHGLDEKLPSCNCCNGWVYYSRGGTSDRALLRGLSDILRISWRHFGLTTALLNGGAWTLKLPLRLYRWHGQRSTPEKHD